MSESESESEEISSSDCSCWTGSILRSNSSLIAGIASSASECTLTMCLGLMYLRYVDEAHLPFSLIHMDLFFSRVSVFFFFKICPSLSEEEQITVGDEWAHYMEVEIKEEDLSLRVDHFWRKVFGGIDSSGNNFVVLPKMVKCALALSFQYRC